jgi:cell division protease FtsH
MSHLRAILAELDRTYPQVLVRWRALVALLGRTRYAIAVAFILVALGAGLGLLIGTVRPISGSPTTVTASGGPVSLPSGAPDADYVGPWSLLELGRHIGAGEVVAITVVTTQAQSEGQVFPVTSLVAETRAGQIVPLAAVGGVPQTVLTLRNLGYDNLLTTEAEAEAITAGATSPAGTPDSLGTLLFVLLLVGGALLFTVAMRRRSMTGLLSRRGGHFRVLMPRRPKTSGGEGAAVSDADDDEEELSPDEDDLVPRVTMDDVAGCDEAKFQLTQTIAFLRDPTPFHALGAQIPRGVMLYGPPGTGKTLLAKAVANSAEVPFISASGSEFVEMYVGVGARRVRDLFEAARKFDRAIVFIDEFDAIGKRRSGGGPGGNDERETALNQLLVELDGFETTSDVVVIAATNRIDTIDEALLRPGRFSRKVEVHLPDIVGRRAILAVHARGKPLAPDVDLEAIARKTARFSGAQLEDLLNEAAICAAERGAEAIGAADLQVGMRHAVIGVGRQRSMDERERSIIAAHEAGHAICNKVWGDKQKIEEISLFTHGEALGYTHLSEEDNALPSETDLRARLVALMGGRAAEEILFEELTGGASNDFAQANQIATMMVTRLGLGLDPDSSRPVGPSGRGRLSLFVEQEGQSLPRGVREAQAAAIGALLEAAYASAKATLLANMATLSRVAGYCYEHERIDGETFEAVYAGTRRPSPRFEREWRSALAHPRSWADIAALSAPDASPASLRGTSPTSAPHQRSAPASVSESGPGLPAERPAFPDRPGRSADPARRSTAPGRADAPEHLGKVGRPGIGWRARLRPGLLALANRLAAFAQKES